MQISGATPTSRTALQPMQGGLVQNGLHPALTGNVTGAQGLGTGGIAPQNLTPVQQGELARAQQVQARGEGFIQDIVDALRNFIQDLLGGAGKQPQKPGKPEGPTGPTGPTAPSTTVEGAKTIEDFKLVGASKQDRADFKAMLEYLQRADANGKAVSPTAVALLAKLPDNQVVKINNNHEDYFDPNNGEIGWDPRSALKVGGTEKFQSPAMGFIHEVDHAVNMITPKPTGDNYHNTEEKRVITGSETTIANDLGEPTRTDHLGDVVHVASPTEHS